MGKYLILKAGGGGIDPDDLTANVDDVVKGKIAGVAGQDDPVTGTLELTGTAAAGEVLSGKTYYTTNPKTKQTGTMANRGAVSQALNAGSTYTIPGGYHNGSGKVTANSLASQTSATATAAYISSGKTAWVNGSKVTGTLATQGGSTTTPGTANKTVVTASKHVTGNIVVAGNSNLTAGNIKKGVNIFGVTGTWEGYIATPADLYNNGVNSAGFTCSGSNVTFESNSIKFVRTSPDIKANKAYNFTAYSKLNIEYLYTNATQPYVVFTLKNGAVIVASLIVTSIGSKSTISLDVSALQLTFSPVLSFRCVSGASGSGTVGTLNGYIYRIWLS